MSNRKEPPKQTADDQRQEMADAADRAARLLTQIAADLRRARNTVQARGLRTKVDEVLARLQREMERP